MEEEEKGVQPKTTKSKNENKEGVGIKKIIKSEIVEVKNYESQSLSKKSTSETRKIKRELKRVINSASYRIGNTIINSIIRPWKIIFLPFNLIRLSWTLVAEKLGKKTPPGHNVDTSIDYVKNKKTVVFFPTNGVGFGHFTRLLAVAKRFKKLDPFVEIIFFTTMPTLHILKEQGGFAGYHIPGRKKFDKMEAKTWNLLTEEFLENIFAIHKPNLFIFDGAFPYRGMINSITNQKDLRKIWLRRGTLKKGAKTPIDSLNKFDYIIKPKDSIEFDIENEEKYNPDLITCNPIILLDNEELLERNKACARLGIPEESTIVYVQLGAGNINDINSEIGMTLDILDEYENTYVILGESMIGERLNVSGKRIRIIRDYPNSRFFNAFDFAIMAAGYNSFHEAVQFSLPTIFFPNLNTGQDDQLARAKIAEDVGAMVVLRKRTKNKIAAAIERLHNKDVRKRMKKKSELLHSENGAIQIAKYLLNMINED